MKDQQPLCAKAYGKWALIGFIIGIVLSIVVSIISACTLAAIGGGMYY